MGEAAIADILEKAVAQGAAPGFSAAWIGPDNIAKTTTAGAHGIGDATAMQPDSVFWIASLTKAITSAAALLLVERGLVSLDEPVGRHLPQLAAPEILVGFDASEKPITRPAKTAITLRHLLTHSSGLAYDFFNADITRHGKATGAPFVRGAAPDIPLTFEPGGGWQYGIGPEWAGQLIAKVTGRDLAEFFGEELLIPLGMADTDFSQSHYPASRRVAVHARMPDGTLAPIAFALPEPPHFGMGGGGLYSTASDYLKFLTMILNNGEVEGRRILSTQSISAMTTAQVSGRHVGVLTSANPATSHDVDLFPGQKMGWSIGFLMNSETGLAGRSPGSLAWAGLANCYCWADPKRHIAGVLLAQLLPFGDRRILDVFADFERALYR